MWAAKLPLLGEYPSIVEPTLMLVFALGSTNEASPEICGLPLIVSAVPSVVVAERMLPFVGSVAPRILVLPFMEIEPRLATPYPKMPLAFWATP